MSWRKFLPGFKVPKEIERLVKVGLLQDMTWEPDFVPHFEARLVDGSELVLWVDHPNPARRIIENGPRYGLERYIKGRSPETLFESSELDETLVALRGILEELGGPRLV